MINLETNTSSPESSSAPAASLHSSSPGQMSGFSTFLYFLLLVLQNSVSPSLCNPKLGDSSSTALAQGTAKVTSAEHSQEFDGEMCLVLPSRKPVAKRKLQTELSLNHGAQGQSLCSRMEINARTTKYPFPSPSCPSPKAPLQ